MAAALRGEQPVPPPERIADILRGEPAPTVAPEAGAGGPASELVSARQSVSSPQAARAALDAARALTRQVADLRADPATTVPIPGVPHPVLQAAFDASSLAYDAATGAHQAYDAAYRAAQLADRTGGPAATEAGRHAEATHGLSQRTNGEYQSALAANEAAQQGGPPAVLHAAQATAHAEQAASLHLQAADAAGRAVAAAADAFDIPTPAPAPEAGVMTPDPPSGTTGPATTPEHGDVAAPTQAFPGPGPAPAPDAGVAAVDSPAAPPAGAADRPGRPSTPTSPAAGAVPPAPPLASTPPAPASPGPPPAGTSRGQAAPGPSQAGPAGSGSPAEAGRGQAAPGSAQAGPPPAAAGRGPGARAGEAGEQGLSAAEADRIRAALEPDAPPAAGGAAPPELPPPGPPTGAAAQPAGEPDPGHEIQSAARVVDQARSTLAAIDGQVERLARSAADARQAAPAPAEEAGRAAVATAVQLAYEAAQVAVEVANAAARAAHAAAAVHAGADPVPHTVVEAADAAEYAHHQAQVAVRDYEEVREVVGRAPAAGEGRPRADEVVARAMRTVDSTARAVGAASEALRAAGRALAETGRAADVWPDAAVPEWLRPPGEPAPSRRAPARPSAPGSPGRGSAEFPDLVGDLVFDRPEQLGPAQRAAVQQAIAELLENRTYGDGFTVRVRSVEIGRGSTHFEIAVFSGSREVGLTQHTVRWDGDVLVAHHSLIDVGGVRGRGFGRDWTEHLERWFRASGVDHITLHAVRAGTYAWARLGYRWVDEGQARQILDWLQTLTTGPDTTPSEVAAARELLDRAARFPWGHELFPTIAEIAEIGRTEPRPGLEHVEHLGRRTLTIGWYGRKDLR